MNNRRNDDWGFGLEHLSKTEDHRCFECGTYTSGRHHVLPASLGGTKQIPLCFSCHGKVHSRPDFLSASELTKEGIRRAKERGVRFGRPKTIPSPKISEAKKLSRQGKSVREIGKILGISHSTAWRFVNTPDAL